MISLARTIAITTKECKQLARDRLTIGMIVMIPLIQLLLFGFAINTNVRHIPIAVVDMSQTALSRSIIQSVVSTQVVRVAAVYHSMTEAKRAITRGSVRAVFMIPQDLPARFIQKRMFKEIKTTSQFDSENRPIAQWLVDGSDTLIGNAIKGLRNMPMLDIDLYTRSINTLPTTFEVVQFFNTEQRSAVNIIPGLVGIILTMTMIMFTSAAIVREREYGNLEFLISTPVLPIELMIGKIIPYVFIGLLQAVIILSLGYSLFSVPINGSFITILVVSVLFIFTSLCLGLFISTIAKTQLQSMQMTVFILLPSILLSGFMFPYEGMPALAQWIAEIFPATHFMRMIRAVVLRSASVWDCYRDIVWNIGFMTVVLTLATIRFRKKLE